MKLTCLISDVKAGIALIHGSIAPEKSGPPNVLLRAGEAGLELAATDYLTHVEVPVSAKVRADGGALVLLDTLRRWIEGMPEGPLEMEVKGYNLHLTTADTQARIAGIPPDDFHPMVKDEDVRGPLHMEGMDLVRAITGVAYATARESDKPATMCVHLVPCADGGRLWLEALNGFQLARAWLPAQGEWCPSATIPISTLTRVARVLESGDTSIEVGPRSVLLRQKGVALRLRQSDATMPDIDKVLERSGVLEGWSTRATVDSKPLVAGLETVATLADEHRIAKGTRTVVLTIGGNAITISAAGQAGDARLALAAETVGPERKLKVSANMLAEGVRASGGERIILELPPTNRLMVLRVPDLDTWSGVQMLME